MAGRPLCCPDRLRTDKTSVLPKIEHVDLWSEEVFYPFLDRLTQGGRERVTTAICVARGSAKSLHKHVGVSLHFGKDECRTYLERIEFLLYMDG